MNTIRLLFAHGLAKTEAMNIIANYYTCSSQTGHRSSICVIASKRSPEMQRSHASPTPTKQRGCLWPRLPRTKASASLGGLCPFLKRTLNKIPCNSLHPKTHTQHLCYQTFKIFFFFCYYMFNSCSFLPTTEVSRQTRHIINTHMLILHSHHTFNLRFQRDAAIQLPLTSRTAPCPWLLTVMTL